MFYTVGRSFSRSCTLASTSPCTTYADCLLFFASLAPSHAPEKLSAVALNSTTLSLSWSAPPSDHHNGVIRRYHIIVTEVETGRVFQVNSTATSATLLSLHPYYAYICAVAAFTIAEGPYSTKVSIRLPEDSKPIL